MACETIKERIDGHDVTVVQMPAEQCLEYDTRLIPVLLQVAAPVLSTWGEDDEIQSATIAAAMAAVSDVLPPKEMSRLILDLCNQAFVDGERVEGRFNEVFSGGQGVGLRYKIAWFVLKANYSDFLSALIPEGALERAGEKFKAKMAAE